MIDWTKDVQMASLHNDDWEDFVVIVPNEDHVYGHPADEDKTYAGIWHFTEWRFRNKLPETKRVRGFVNIYPDFVYETRDEARIEASHFCIACVEIDVHEGHGLEEGK